MASNRPAKYGAKGSGEDTSQSAPDTDCRIPDLHRELDGKGNGICEAIEAIPLPLLIVQSETVLFANSAVEETFGYTPRRLVGRDWSCLVPKIADRRKLKKLASFSGRVRGLEVHGEREDKSTLWLSVWQKRIVFHGRECLLIILIDVTREKRDVEQMERQQIVLKQLLELSDQDRELIACDIHDGVIQDMTGALMHLQAARRALENGKPDAIEQLTNVVQMLRDGISEARRLIDGVRPPELERVGLVGAIALLVERTASTKGIAIEFSHDISETRLSAQAENALYRIVQECLNNVWQHSRSPSARVDLTETGRLIRLSVKDQGIGFDPEQVGHNRFGLAGVRQRTRLLEGTVQVRSAAGKGCTVRVTLPLERAKSPELTG